MRFNSLRQFILLSVLLFLNACASQQDKNENSTPPNIVIIYSDDLGYAQLSSTRERKFTTKSIDRIGQEGINFTNGYVSGPVCAPSRAGLMTGRYQIRYNYESFTGPISQQIENNHGVPTNEIFMTDLLKKQGYKTAHIGKWHLGYNAPFHPNRRGVDYFFGWLSGGHDYFEWDVNKQQAVINGGGPVLENDKEVSGEGYMTEALTAKTCEFIRKNKSNPFYVMYAPFNVHTPLQVPEKYIPKGGSKLDGMVVALDKGVEDILKALDENNLTENTIVLFINDNGGSRKFEKNGILRDFKGSVYEGGIRVPFMVRWPKKFKAGQVCHEPVIQLDVLPTVVAAAGGTLPTDREIDGVNLLPFLTGQSKVSPHQTLFWRHWQKKAVREGDWKLVKIGKSLELFNIKEDIGETKDLKDKHPKLTKRLEKKNSPVGEKLRSQKVSQQFIDCLKILLYH